MRTILEKIAQTLNLQPDDTEEAYILTKDEEREIVHHAIEKQKKHFCWRMTDKGCSPELIRQKLVNKVFTVNESDLFKTANRNKHRLVWEKEQRDREREQELLYQTNIKETCTAKYIYQLMRATSEANGKKLIVNEDNKHLITAICYFLSQDPLFEELGYSFKKGILIRGVTGVGKTHLIKCVAGNKLNPIDIVSMMDLNDKAHKEGYFDLQFARILYMDDVGSEETYVNNFGTKFSYFKTFIENYHLHGRAFDRLIISTNTSFEDLENKYGYRVRSRLREMFNVIDLPGKDMR